MDRNSPQFKALQEKWYKKAAAKGFDDIEQSDGRLKEWHSQLFYAHREGVCIEAVAEYGRMTGYFLNEYKFANQTERKIWERHDAGKSVQEIADEFKKRRIKAGYGKIYNTIRRLRSIMMETYGVTRPKTDNPEE